VKRKGELDNGPDRNMATGVGLDCGPRPRIWKVYTRKKTKVAKGVWKVYTRKKTKVAKEGDVAKKNAWNV